MFRGFFRAIGVGSKQDIAATKTDAQEMTLEANIALLEAKKVRDKAVEKAGEVQALAELSETALTQATTDAKAKPQLSVCK